MKEELLVELYEKRNDRRVDQAIRLVNDLEQYVNNNGEKLDTISLVMLKRYIQILIDKEENSLENIIAIARYYYVINNKDIYIYFTKLLGGLGVVENIRKRIVKFTNEETAVKVFEGLDSLPLGTEPEKIPNYTRHLMDSIKQMIPDDLVHKILAGNNHSIPIEAMLDEKKYYDESESLEVYLRERHARKVKELQLYCDEDKVWYEQIITQKVVDFVASNQEILSAKLQDNKLYVTKIPFETEGYLSTVSDTEKRYFACHCPFAREAIRLGLDIDPDWCYCSAGFAKYPFEVILDKKLDVKVLETPLDGSTICRFEIDLGQ
jgi:hypothetical protein